MVFKFDLFFVFFFVKVLKSLEAEKWLPEENYEIKDFFPSAKV